MARFGFLSLLLSLQALIGSGFAAEATAENTGDEAEAPNLAVSAQASFPDAEVFGVKLVNGHPTRALISVTNEESAPVTVSFIGGTLSTFDEEQSTVIRNLTTTRYGVEIPAGQKEELSYSFVNEMHPQDLRLALSSIVSDAEGRFFNVNAYNATVSVVEPETSIFDPHILFLYFFLLACFSGIGYFFYAVWIAPYFPQKRKSGKGPEFSKKPSSTSKKNEASSPSEAPDSPTVPSATTYNADWIPAHHINRPEARKVKGTARSKTRA